MSEPDDKEQFKQKFIDRVRQARASTGKKQWEVALLMGVDQDEYKHWEQQGKNGRVIPTHLIARFCFAVHVEPIWILTGHGRMKGSPVPELVQKEPAPQPQPAPPVRTAKLVRPKRRATS